MPSINIYKITKDGTDELIAYLSKEYEPLSEITHKVNCEESTTLQEYTITLYFSHKDNPGELKWNWVLSMFGQAKQQVYSAPKGVIVFTDGERCYALTFGHSFFQIDKYSDKNWAFSYARTLNFVNIKTTALTNPHSQRNKTVNTYLRYEELEFDSGEALSKLKARVFLDDETSLFTENMEFGNSIKLSVKKPISIPKIVQIIEYIEAAIMNNPIRVKIPFFRKIKDKALITELKAQLIEDVTKNICAIDISEYQIFATQIVFSANYDYRYESGNNSKEISCLDANSLFDFIAECELPYSEMLNVSVSASEDGVEKYRKSAENLVFYTNDDKKALLMDGEWYLYNDDYLEYLSDSIYDIPVVCEPQYNYSKQEHDMFIDVKYNESLKEKVCENTSEAVAKQAIKHKFYKENYFNTTLEEQHGFANFDRQLDKIGKHKMEVMDLYKDNVMYTVKFGNASSDLCYAVDQSLAAINAYKKRLINLPNIPIKEVCIWLVLERSELSLVNGRPDINELDMLILKNKLDIWKKDVRLLGYTPTLRINYTVK